MPRSTAIWWAQISYCLMLQLNGDGSAVKSKERYISQPIFVEAGSKEEAKGKILTVFCQTGHVRAREMSFYDSIQDQEGPYPVVISEVRSS